MFNANRTSETLTPFERGLEERLSKMRDESGRVRRFCREEIPKGWIIYLGKNMERKEVLALAQQYDFKGWENVVGNEHAKGTDFRPHTTLFYHTPTLDYSLKFVQPVYTNGNGNGNGHEH